MSSYGNEWDLGVGTVRLLRGFDIRQYGVGDIRLVSPMYPYAWEGDVNEAYCPTRFMGLGVQNPVPLSHWKPIAEDRTQWAEHGWEEKKGRCEDPSHLCGFYGAYLGEPTWGVLGGVIEGFGKVTMGTKGCRVEKARILALLADIPEEEPNPKWTKRTPWRRKHVKNVTGANFRKRYPDTAIISGSVEDMLKAYPLSEPPL